MCSARCRGPGSRPGPGRSRRASCSSWFSSALPALVVFAVVLLQAAEAQTTVSSTTTTTTTQAIESTTEAAVSTTEAVVSTTEAIESTTEAIVSTTEAAVSTTEAAVSTTEAVVSTTTTTTPTAPEPTEKTIPDKPPCPKRKSVELGRSEQLAQGAIHNLQDGQIYPAGTWYTTQTVTRGCPCMIGTCFLKCCQAGLVMYWDKPRRKTACVSPADLRAAQQAEANATDTASPERELNATLVLDLYSLSNLDEPQRAGVQPPRDWIMLYGKPVDKGMRLRPESLEIDAFYLLLNGSLFVPGHYGLVLPPSNFCMDVFEDTGTVSAIVPFPPDRDDIVSGLTLPDFVNIVGLLVSLPFLMATFLVYATIGELQNLHGKSLMCHVGAMTLAFMDLLLVKFGIGSDLTPVCKFLGFFLQFTFLACFFWLNIMCFDIWWTFSGFRSVHGSPSWSAGERLRFRLYSAYAWGAPLLILVVTVLVQEVGDALRLPDGALPWYVIYPGVGTGSCYLEAAVARYAYFTGPMAVLLLCNVGLFLHTAIRIVQLRRETRALQGAESRRHADERNRYIVYLKLFVTMGGYWIAEILSGVLPEWDYLWVITDVPNSLQGILIFIMCVGTGHVRTLVLNRLFHRRGARTLSSHSGVSSTRTTNTRANGSGVHGGSLKEDLSLQQVKVDKVDKAVAVVIGVVRNGGHSPALKAKERF